MAFDLQEQWQQLREKAESLAGSGRSRGRSALRSGRCLILSTERPHVVAMSVAFNDAGPRLLNSLHLQWPEHLSPVDAPQEAGVWLKEQLSAAGMGDTTAYVVFPREEVVVRRIELPDAPDHEIPDLLRMQAATRFTIPLDRLVLDYVPLPTRPEFAGREVMAMAVPASLLGNVSTLFGAAGLQLAGATVSSFALTALDKQVATAPAASDGAGLIVSVAGDVLELAIVTAAGLVFSHSMRVPTNDPDVRIRAVQTEIAKARVAVQAMHPGLSWSRVELTCDESLRPALAARLAERLHTEIGTLPVFNTAGIELSGNVADQPETLWAKAVGYSLLLADPTIDAVDFVTPRRPQPPLDRRVLARRVGAAAAVLILILWYWNLQSYAGRLDRDIADLQDRGYELDATLKAGKDDLARHDLIAAWAERSPHWLEEFDALRKRMPPPEQMYLTKVTAATGGTGAVGRISADTRAKDRTDIQELTQELAEQPRYRVDPYNVTLANRDPEYPAEFELKVELNKVAAGGDAATPAAGDADAKN